MPVPTWRSAHWCPEIWYLSRPVAGGASPMSVSTAAGGNSSTRPAGGKPFAVPRCRAVISSPGTEARGGISKELSGRWSGGGVEGWRSGAVECWSEKVLERRRDEAAGFGFGIAPTIPPVNGSSVLKTHYSITPFFHRSDIFPRPLPFSLSPGSNAHSARQTRDAPRMTQNTRETPSTTAC